MFHVLDTNVVTQEYVCRCTSIQICEGVQEGGWRIRHSLEDEALKAGMTGVVAYLFTGSFGCASSNKKRPCGRRLLLYQLSFPFGLFFETGSGAGGGRNDTFNMFCNTKTLRNARSALSTPFSKPHYLATSPRKH